jgi:hypothetical protein
MKINNEGGISLIVLVITIIVIIILAGSVILSLSQNNPILSSTEASFKSTVESYNSQLAMTLSSKYVLDFTFNPKALYATTWDGNDSNKSGTVKEYISSMTIADGSNYIIQQGKLIYTGSDVNKKTWSSSLGLSDPYVKSGLVLWLDGADFKNSPQTTSWIDRSGNGNNAIPANFNYTTSSGSDGNNGVVFDGINDNMKILHNASLMPNDITISVLINANNWSSPVASNLIIKRDATNSYFFFADTTGALSFDWSTRWNIAYTVPTSRWVSLTITRDATKRKLYVDGALVTETTDVGADPIGTSDLYIGADINGNRYFYNGSMRSIAMYNRALTATEIDKNYNADKLRFNL